GVCEREGQRRLEEPRLVSAIEAPSAEAQTVEWLAPDQPGHGIGQLHFVACPGLLHIQFPEDFRLQDIASDDAGGGRRLGRFRLLDQPLDLDQPAIILTRLKHPVTAGGLARHLPPPPPRAPHPWPSIHPPPK